MAHVIIGTAGHIDHGKSALVMALTGTDPDRLSEEQERGMTIDLGFAFLSDQIAFIDVPGHERFIKNMVAGVSTVDMAILVVAADDGVMPQTREHLDILSLLQLKRGVVVVTKVDLAEKEWLDLIEEEVVELVAGTFLQGAPVYRVSSVTGQGVEPLREGLIQLASETEPRPDRGLFWMPIDRSFTIKGFGTVVTGSVLSGQLSAGETLEQLPARAKVRVRGLQAHGRSVDQVSLGDRAAVNLAGVGVEEIARGDVLATPDLFAPSRLFDVRLSLLKSAKKAMGNRTRVRLHVGTREILARLKLLDADRLEPGGSALVQCQLESEAVAMRRDPFVIRSYSPPLTIGGGVILDPHPRPHRRNHAATLETLQQLEGEDPVEALRSALLGFTLRAPRAAELARLTGARDDELAGMLELLENEGELKRFGSGAKTLFFHKRNFDRLRDKVLADLAEFHYREPLQPGIKRAGLRRPDFDSALFDAVLASLLKEGDIRENPPWIRLSSHAIRLSETERVLAEKIKSALRAGGYSPPSGNDLARILSKPQAEVKRILNALLGLGEIMRMEGEIYFLSETVSGARDSLADLGEEFTVSEFREALKTTRKYAMALLSYFDQQGWTHRSGDIRMVNRESLE